MLWLKKGRRLQPGVLSLLPVPVLIIVVGVWALAAILSLLCLANINDGVGNFPVAVGGAELSVFGHPPEDAAHHSCDVSSPAKSSSEPCPNILGALPV